MLSLLCLAGTGGCLRLQQGDEDETTVADGSTAAGTDTGEGERTTEAVETEEEATLDEQWTTDFHLNNVWSVNNYFFVLGYDAVARVVGSGLDWTRQIPGENGVSGRGAFAQNNSRVLFGISPDEEESEDADAGAQFLAHNSASGNRLWRYEMPTEGRHDYARGAAFVDDIAVLGSHSYGSDFEHDPLVVGVDADTGEQRWETHLADVGAKYLSSMSVYDGSVHVGMADRGVALLDPETGSVERTFEAMRTLTVGGTVSGGTLSGDVTAASLDDGRTQWSGTVDDRTYTQPAVDNTLVVVGTGAGTVYAFERPSGEVRWTRQVTGAVHALTTTPSRVWVADRNDGLTAFARDTGVVQHRSTRRIEDMESYGNELLIGSGDTVAQYTIA